MARDAPHFPDRSAPPKDRVPVRVAAERGDLARTKSPLVVVGAFEDVDEFHGVTAAVDEATGGALTRVLRAGDFRGRSKETALVHPAKGDAERVLLVGLGPIQKWTPDRLRRVSALVARRAREMGVDRYHTALHGLGSPGVTIDAAACGEAMAEGALLGLYAFTFYKGPKGEKEAKEEARRKLSRIVLVDRDAASAKAAAEGA
ncbi:MAG TPA: M17 family peptidase N-terminal domain-containing protein, partial [Candidatus Thermoplasmatota archaeon]|nr:M17 family peptidase N-terminal domain-containing protein [Candidatus Thermoplasmatota archaeon]